MAVLICDRVSCSANLEARCRIWGCEMGLGGSGVYEQLSGSEACDSDDVDRIWGWRM